MTARQISNNIARGAIQALALTLAGVRAMEISAFDEAIRTPSREAHLVALRTQHVVRLESGAADVADPLGGSWYVEALTDQLERRILDRVAFIEGCGDVVELAEQGFFRAIFAEAMVERAREVADGRRRSSASTSTRSRSSRTNCCARSPRSGSHLATSGSRRSAPGAHPATTAPSSPCSTRSSAAAAPART